mmetsp:Transcript_8499/g.25547  ORF Transcript_8499/g.25547 Transcript_8499/m.25547 type:complete len:275 (+) Transcript_8499:556-1380(+)
MSVYTQRCLASIKSWSRLSTESAALLQVIRVLGLDGPGASKEFAHPAFVIPKKVPGKFRTVVDCTELNLQTPPVPFKYDQLVGHLDQLDRARFGFTFDLVDAFYLVPLGLEYRHLFRFCLQCNGQRRVYELTSLPMGWCRSPEILTRFLAPVRDAIRDLDVVTSSVLYLDDGLGVELDLSGGLVVLPKTKTCQLQGLAKNLVSTGGVVGWHPSCMPGRFAGRREPRSSGPTHRVTQWGREQSTLSPSCTRLSCRYTTPFSRPSNSFQGWIGECF